MTNSAALQKLLDKEAIRELVQIYCRAADRHDNELMRSLYHEDATDDHGSFFKGLAMEFIDKLPEIQVPMEILHHNVTTHNIELQGDRAEGEVYVLAFHKIRTDEGSIDLPDTGALCPRQRAELSEAQRGFYTALETLTVKHREIILLRHVEELDYAQIAEILDVPVGTVMSRLFHARRKLREAMAPFMETSS